MIIRYQCLISSCDWAHCFPDVPAMPWPWQGSIHDTVAAVSLADAAVREQVVREHFETHPIIEWAGEVQRQRQRVEGLEAQLAAWMEAIEHVEGGGY